ncbi:hypothetical protein ACFLQV_00410 [Calditrichota bacterium]
MDSNQRRKIRVSLGVVHILFQVIMMSIIFIKVIEFGEVDVDSHYQPLVELVAIVAYMLGLYMIYNTIGKLIVRQNIS